MPLVRTRKKAGSMPMSSEGTVQSWQKHIVPIRKRRRIRYDLSRSRTIAPDIQMRQAGAKGMQSIEGAGPRITYMGQQGQQTEKIASKVFKPATPLFKPSRSFTSGWALSGKRNVHPYSGY